MSKNLTTLDEFAAKADKATQTRYEEQKANGVVNPIVLAKLLSVGAGKEVRPQMIYNYLSKGKFTDDSEAVGENSTQKKTIRLDEANTFAKNYVEGVVTREAKAQEKIQAELAGEPVNA